LVELRDDGTLGVGFETVDADFFDVHDVLCLVVSSLFVRCFVMLQTEEKRALLFGGKNVTEHYFYII